MELNPNLKGPEPIFTLVCSECNEKKECSFEKWEELDRHDVLDHFVCDECEQKENPQLS